MKKTKLNSKNPKYNKLEDSSKPQYRKVLIREVSGCKIYAAYLK